jgi:hypothetical protein
MIPRVWPLIIGVLLVFQVMHIPHFQCSDEKETENAAGKRGQDIEVIN